jgi:hypothetical protein
VRARSLKSPSARACSRQRCAGAETPGSKSGFLSEYLRYLIRKAATLSCRSAPISETMNASILIFPSLWVVNYSHLDALFTLTSKSSNSTGELDLPAHLSLDMLSRCALALMGPTRNSHSSPAC